MLLVPAPNPQVKCSLLVEAQGSRDYHRDDRPSEGEHLAKWGKVSMNSVEYFRREVKWTATEKKVARKAFDGGGTSKG